MAPRYRNQNSLDKTSEYLERVNAHIQRLEAGTTLFPGEIDEVARARGFIGENVYHAPPQVRSKKIKGGTAHTIRTRPPVGKPGDKPSNRAVRPPGKDRPSNRAVKKRGT
jgi:hypothetical protein